MAKLRIRPFQVVSTTDDKAIDLGPWSLDGKVVERRTAGGSVFDPALSSSWSRKVCLFPQTFADRARQGDEATFLLRVEIFSAHTNLRLSFDCFSFGAKDPKIDEDIGLLLDGSEIGGQLRMITRVVLRDGDPVDQLGARISGSIIFEEIFEYDLRDEFVGFPHLEPFDMTDYLGMKPGPHWIIRVDSSDLISDATQAVSVSMNVRSKLVQEMLSESSEVVAVQTALLHDIFRRLIAAALDSVEFEAEFVSKTTHSFEDHPRSLGRIMATTLSLCGLAQSLGETRRMREERLEEFEGRIHNHAYRGLAR